MESNIPLTKEQYKDIETYFKNKGYFPESKPLPNEKFTIWVDGDNYAVKIFDNKINSMTKIADQLYLVSVHLSITGFNVKTIKLKECEHHHSKVVFLHNEKKQTNKYISRDDINNIYQNRATYDRFEFYCYSYEKDLDKNVLMMKKEAIKASYHYRQYSNKFNKIVKREKSSISFSDKDFDNMGVI